MNPPPGAPVFVYGTLRTGGGRESLLSGPRRAATTRGALWDLPAGYPALQLGAEGIVHGERVDGVSDAQLQVLDLYEGVAEGLFRRVPVMVAADDGEAYAWAWVMDEPRSRGGRRVPTGRWRRLRER